MPTVTATPQAVIEAHYGRFAWVEDFQVRLDDDRFAEVTLYLSRTRPPYWMDVLDRESHAVYQNTRYRTIFACFDASGDRDLLG